MGGLMKKKMFVAFIVLSFCFASRLQADVGSVQIDPQVMAKLDQLANQFAELQKVVMSQQELIQKQASEIEVLKSVQIEKPQPLAVSAEPQSEVPKWLYNLKFGGDLR